MSIEWRATPEAVRAFREENPTYGDWPEDKITETFAFKLFDLMWRARQVADEIEQAGQPEIAALFRAEMEGKAATLRKAMDEARDSTLRRMGFIP